MSGDPEELMMKYEAVGDWRETLRMLYTDEDFEDWRKQVLAEMEAEKLEKLDQSAMEHGRA